MQRTRYSSEGMGRELFFPIDTRRNPIRHGQVEFSFVVANANRQPAGMRLNFYDEDGRLVALRYQTLPKDTPREWKLSALIDRGEFRGTLHLVSDLPIGAAAILKTKNIRGQEILTVVPHVELGSMSAAVLSPPILDGAGLATQQLWMKVGSGDDRIQIKARMNQGRAWPLILR